MYKQLRYLQVYQGKKNQTKTMIFIKTFFCQALKSCLTQFWITVW